MNRDQTAGREYNVGMEDREVKRRLKKVPDRDASGEPIWKIEEIVDSGQRAGEREAKEKPKKEKRRIGFRS